MMPKFLVAALVSLWATMLPAAAQPHRDFDTLINEPHNMVYKGICTFEDLAGVEDFHWQERVAAYKVQPEVLKLLAAELHQYELVLLLGTWCEDSHQLVPGLYRLLQDAHYPLEKVHIIALDRDKKGKYDEERTYAVQQVPTLIMRLGGVEKGRITETVTSSLEEDMLSIMATVEDAEENGPDE